jgi:methyltransferase (TIGR00027 family)
VEKESPVDLSSDNRPVDDEKWARDYENRCNPQLMTRLLQEAVPTYLATGMKFLEVGRGTCKGYLPLNVESANQHGTHQALLVAMLGDYTGGMALASLFDGEPIAGVHPCRDNAGMSLWLADSSMKYLLPSVGPITSSAQVPRDLWRALHERYEAGRSIYLNVDVTFSSDEGKVVATGQFNYFLKNRLSLIPKSADEPAHVMYRHGQSTTARLIAAMRALETPRPQALYQDPWSEALAGPQGAVIAARFASRIPWLAEMVAARTRHADEAIKKAYADGVRQLVLAPAGLDSRPFRLARACPGMKVFELDLPEMIEERNWSLEKMDAPSLERKARGVNFEFQDPHEALVGAGLDPEEPVFLVYEGCAMYFEPEIAPAVIRKMASVIGGHPSSRMWFDLPTEDAVKARLPDVSLHAFMEGMARLGAPFRFGHNDPRALAQECGLQLVEEVPSDFARPSDDPVFDQYRFLLLRSAAA